MKLSGRKSFLVIFLSIISLLGLNAQTFKGRVINTKGGNAVEFANVMLKTTTTGAASDDKGQFIIDVPENMNSAVLEISAVGYTKKDVLVSSLNEKRVNLITLSPIEYNIDEVDIQAESMILYGVLKKCNQNITNNYITTPYSSQFYYKANDRKLGGIMSDNSGYKRTTAKGSMRRINYHFYQENNKEKNVPYFNGSTKTDDLLSYDIMRTTGNFMDIKKVYDFDLKYVESNDPTLWMIHFKAKNPEVHNTGEAHATSYEGELYIDKGSYAVSKVIIRGTSAKRSIHGRGIIVSDKSSSYITDVNYETTVNYRIVKGQYQLHEVTMTENFTDLDGKAQTLKTSLEITKQLPDYTKIDGRDYFAKSL